MARKLIQSFLRLPKRRYPYWHVNHDLKVIFLHNPKAAGTSIMRALGLVHCQEEEFLIDQGHPPQFRLRKTHKDWWKRYLKIAWVRSPMSRAISAYQFSRAWTPPLGAAGGRAVDCDLLRERSFEDCCRLMLDWPDALQQPMWKPQSYFISEPEEFDFIGRYERTEEDWKILCDRIGFDLPLFILNASQPVETDPARYYTPRACAAIAALYKSDFVRFGYRLPLPLATNSETRPLTPPQCPDPPPVAKSETAGPAKPCSGCGPAIKIPQKVVEIIQSIGGIEAPPAIRL